MKSSFRSKRSLRRSMASVAAGAMVIALFPAGAAFADSRGTEDVCPAPGGNETFDDVDDGTHADNIECLAGYGIAQGYGDGTYGPWDDIRRDQMATYIANFVETATGAELPEGDSDFEDIDGNLHEENIEQLAAADIVSGTTSTTYSPDANVNRDQMATYIRQAIDYVDDGDADNNSAPPPSGGDPFTDVAPTNAHYDNIQAIAGVDIVTGTSETEYSPDENVARAQMATFVMQAADYLAELGLWNPTPPPDNQDYEVTPGDEATNQASTPTAPNQGRRAYEVTGLEDTETYNVALFPAENVSVDDNGVVTFEDAGEDEHADRPDTEASIEVINGLATDQTDEQTASPEDGTITFQIDSTNNESVIPAVWLDTDVDTNDDPDPDNELDVNTDGEPTEEFGIGGQKNWFVEATAGEVGADETVEFVNDEDNYFDTDGGRYFYDADDTFQIIDGTCETVAQGTFETNLSVGDTLDASSVYGDNDPNDTSIADDSTFCIDDVAPTEPTINDAVAQSDSSIEVTWSGTPTDTEHFNVYRSTEETPVFADGDYAVVDTVATEAGETDYEYLDTGLSAGTEYTYVVTAEADDDESAPSGEASATTFEAGQTINAQSEDATVTNDAGAGVFGEEGTVSGGDEWQVVFDQPLDALDEDEAIRVVGENGNEFVADCDTTDGNATCSLNESTVERDDEEYAAGEVLTVVLAEDATPTTDVTYPAEITQVTGFDSGAGEWVLAESPDTTLEVDEESAVTPLSPVFTGGTADATANDATFTFSEDITCDDVDLADYDVTIGETGATPDGITCAGAVDGFDDAIVVDLTTEDLAEDDVVTITATAANDVSDRDGNTQPEGDTETATAVTPE